MGLGAKGSDQAYGVSVSTLDHVYTQFASL